MAETAFTWFPKLTRILKTLPAENVAEFALAVAAYGTDGEEPSFSSPVLAAVFEGVRDDVDNSVNARTKNKGGRPKSENRRENGGSEVSKPTETPVSVSENPSKPPLCEVSEDGNPPLYKPSHTKPNQTNTDQAKPKRKGAFAPPPLEEIEGWAKSEGWPIDAAAFKAYYDSNGWKVGRNPMRDWRAAAESWCRRDGLSRRDPGAKPKEPPSCPKCGARLFRNTQSGRWECPGCCETFAREAVA